MTKQLEIYPEELFKPGHIEFTPIPVCQYRKTVAEERKLYSVDDFQAIYHDMVVLRTFENIIDAIKKVGEYRGIA